MYLSSHFYRVFHKMCRKILRDASAHPNKKHSSENAWSKIKRKWAGVFENLFHAKVKSPFLLRIIVRKMTKLACTSFTRKAKDAYAKYRLDYCLNAAELSVKFSITVATYQSCCLSWIGKRVICILSTNLCKLKMVRGLAFVIEVGFATLLLSLNRFLCIFYL